MLLSMGGLTPGSTAAATPPEARAIVRYCNRLPLAIGIAAKLVKELALDGGSDSESSLWDGVLSIMREEFEGGQSQSMEESVVSLQTFFFLSSHP